MKRASSGGASTVRRRELAVGLHVDDAADAVDVAGHDVAAQLVAGLQRPLQVDALARPASRPAWCGSASRWRRRP